MEIDLFLLLKQMSIIVNDSNLRVTENLESHSSFEEWKELTSTIVVTAKAKFT